MKIATLVDKICRAHSYQRMGVLGNELRDALRKVGALSDFTFTVTKKPESNTDAFHIQIHGFRVLQSNLQACLILNVSAQGVKGVVGLQPVHEPLSAFLYQQAICSAQPDTFAAVGQDVRAKCIQMFAQAFENLGATTASSSRLAERVWRGT